MVRGVFATSLQSHLRTCCQRDYSFFLLFLLPLLFPVFIVDIILCLTSRTVVDENMLLKYLRLRKCCVVISKIGLSFNFHET